MYFTLYASTSGHNWDILSTRSTTVFCSSSLPLTRSSIASRNASSREASTLRPLRGGSLPVESRYLEGICLCVWKFELHCLWYFVLHAGRSRAELIRPLMVSAHSLALTSHAKSIVLWKLKVRTGYTFSESCFCVQIEFCTTKKQFYVKQKTGVWERRAGFSGRFFCFPEILFGFVLTCFFRQSMCTVWPSDTVIDVVPRSVLALLIVSAPFALSLTVSPSSNVFEQMLQPLNGGHLEFMQINHFPGVLETIYMFIRGT